MTTETRLRDYLRTQASTVPDNAEAPGFDESAGPKRSVWPVLTAAAAIGAVLVLTVPLLTRLGDKQPPAASTGISVPYYLTDLDNEQSTLHDGDVTVAMPKGFYQLHGRVSGGWAAAVTTPRPGGLAKQIGVLQADGTLRPIVPKESQHLVLSPDRKQAASAQPLGNGKTRVTTYDVASGSQAGSVTLPHQTTVLYGWNKDGVWLAEALKVGAQPSVWQPSTGRVTDLTVRGSDLRLVAPSGSDRVLVVARPQPDKWCMQAVRLVAGKLTVDREYCGTGGRSVYPTLSPDGSTMLFGEQNLAVDVATGRQTTIRAPYAIEDLDGSVFEDATHVLSVFSNSGTPAPSRTPTRLTPSPGLNLPKALYGDSLKDRSVYRCDVTDGTCEKAYDIPDGKPLTLVQP